MSFSPALTKSLLMAASIGMVVPMMAQPPAPRPPKQKSKNEQPDAPPQAENQVVGLELTRKAGGFLGLSIDQGNFVLRFYDADKKPIPPDAARATVRWNPIGKVGEERTVLLPGNDGVSFTTTKIANPPYAFKAYLVVVAADDTVLDTYAVSVTSAMVLSPAPAP